jgi:hypothetical protein
MIVYTVYGGYPEQEESDHWATFRSLEYARAYRDEQLRLAGNGLVLVIGEDTATADEETADDEWLARFNPYCTSGCRLGGDICSLCEPFFVSSY